MNKRKVVSILIVSALLSGSSINSFAAVEDNRGAAVTKSIDKNNEIISKVKAEDIALNALKTYFKIDIKEKNLKNISETEPATVAGKSVWKLTWAGERTEYWRPLVEISVDAKTGKVKSMLATLKNDEDGEKEFKVTSNAAEKIAKEISQKMNGEELKLCSEPEIIEEYSYGFNMYSVKYIRKVNGVKFPENFIEVLVDGVDGNLVSYKCNWNDDIKVSENQKIINNKEAEDILKKELNFQQVYVEKLGYEGKDTVDLFYTYKHHGDNVYVDGVTGKVQVEPIDKIKSIWVKKDLDKNVKENIVNNCKQNKNKPIADKKAAEDLIKAYIKDIYGDGYVVEGLSYNKLEGGTYKSWTANFYKDKDGKREYSGLIRVNNDTQLIERVSRKLEQKPIEKSEKAALSFEQAFQKAFETAAKYYPDKIKNISTEQSVDVSKEDKNIFFVFGRIENGIDYNGDFISVYIDTISGEVKGMHCNWLENAEIPNLKNAISKEKAAEIYFKTFKPELIYIVEDYNTMKLKLVYKINSENDVNAITGEIVKWGIAVG